MTSVRDEERAALAQARALAKASRGAAARRAQQDRQKVADAIEHTARLFPSCRCGLRRGMTSAALRDLGGGCTMPQHACPRLDAVRRRIER